VQAVGRWEIRILQRTAGTGGPERGATSRAHRCEGGQHRIQQSIRDFHVERTFQQYQRRFAQKGAGTCGPGKVKAGEFAWPPFRQAIQTEQAGQRLRLPTEISFRYATMMQARKQDALLHAQMRQPSAIARSNADPPSQSLRRRTW
jgi:hypothetical protein